MKTRPARTIRYREGGFSLVELLVVIVIVGILAVLAAGGFGSVQRSSEMNRAGQLLADQIALARQTATSQNRDVELRIVQLPGNTQPGWSGIQMWVADEGGTMTPSGRLQTFPTQAVISPLPVLSPLLTADANRSGTATFGSHGQRAWRGFRIRPGGALDPGVVGTTNNFLTIVARSDAEAPQPPAPPDNFYAVRINPVTGRVTVHRP
jgi:uncharacterized protein (TIGR02596 family)